MYKQILDFLFNLRWNTALPSGVQVLNPWMDTDVQELCARFYTRYFGDHQPRTLLMGINPGRFGGGVTGIAFTDPIRLSSCGIDNNLQARTELSSDFIYRVITAYGGALKFYSDFYINSVVPLGFTREGKNLNYYDIPELKQQAIHQIPGWMQQHLDMPIRRDRLICIGEGKNLEVLSALNETHGWFGSLEGLPHPRYVMQYRRSEINASIDRYLKVLAG